MKTLRYFLAISSVLLLSCCAGAPRDEADNKSYVTDQKGYAGNSTPTEELEMTDSTAVDPGSMSSSTARYSDSTHKFIRTADIKFKVANVINATYRIEDIVRRHGGFVTYTNLQSQVNYVTSTAVSADSTLETTWYTVLNSMILRVPDEKLDTMLKDLAPLVDHLDFRTIRAEDISLQLLADELKQKRLKKYSDRMTNAIDEKGKKLRETTYGEDGLLSKQEQMDLALINSLSLKEQVELSTINLSIYQRPAFTRELLGNEKNLEEYEPGLGSRVLDALESGWNGIEAILVFLARIWGLILVFVIAFFAYRRYAGKIWKK